MSDNVSLPASSGKAAARLVNYSGEPAQAQAVGLVIFDGADDAKTVTDVGPENPLPVIADGVEALLRRLVDLLISPAGFDRSQGRARGTVIVESGTVNTVNTVSTVSAVTAVTDITRLNGFGALPAEAVARHQNLAAWQLCHRSTIT